MNWYSLTPVDTLFFKDASPMNLGENHTARHIFPPPPHTISGALRTAVLIQNDIPFDDYGNGRAPDNIYEAIGKAGERPPFELVGPFFMQDETVYIPAPYCWHVPKERSGVNVPVTRMKSINSRLIKTEARNLLWAKSEIGGPVSAGGMWTRLEDLHSDQEIITIKNGRDFFKNEPRTGIALERNRRVREGHLYSFNHVRLNKNVCLVFGTTAALPIQNKGVLKLGGEQRIAWYRKLEKVIIHFAGKGDFFMALSIIEGSDEANRAVVATGKILYLGGWDMKKGFHKPMKGYFPAGSVFNQKINNNFIAIKGV